MKRPKLSYEAPLQEIVLLLPERGFAASEPVTENSYMPNEPADWLGF